MFILTENDRLAIQECSIQLVDGTRLLDTAGGTSSDGRIPIQFPPKVTADSKKSQWGGGEKDQKTLAWEPIRIWKGSDARAVTIELKYVVTGEPSFTGDKIMQIIREFKRIHYGKEDGGIGNVFFWKLSMYNSIIGSPAAAFLCMSTDVKYSPETVRMPPGKPGNAIFFPLITTVTIVAELVTRVAIEGKEKNPVLTEGMDEVPKPQWY